MHHFISRQNDGQVAGRVSLSRWAGWVRSVWLLVLTIACAGGIPAADPVKPQSDLSLQQQQIRRDYERFERSLLEAAENMRRKEPEQSDILDRARQRSQEQALLNEMDKISQELKQNQTGSASDRQRQVIDRMKEILQLLQSEDERDRLQREMERIQELLKDTNRVIAKQRDAKAANQKGSDSQKATDEQKKAAEEAQKLASKIDKQDKARQGESKPTEGKQPDPKDSPGDKPQDSQPKDDQESKEGNKPDPKPGDSQKPGDKKPKDDPEKTPDEKPMPSDSPGKEGEKESKPGKPTKPMDGQESPESQSPPSDKPPMPGSPMPPTPGQQPPPPMDDQESQEQPPQQEDDQQTQGREDLKKAQELMQKALEELEKKSRETAGKEQEQALVELEKLKAKLEEILRQRREEEKELYLAMLEVRFQKMLRLQLQVNAETVRLEKIPEPERSPAHFDKCSEASRQQQENKLEADKTLNLLKEEGSSVAFPEAVEQMIGNMQTISKLLDKANTGDTTQLLEQIVLETLEEIILALQKEMENTRQKKQQGQPQKAQGSPQDEKLVNQLAELKMIRSLQNQVNRITKQIGIQIDGEQAANPEHRKLAEDLAKRQQRIQSATYDLSSGRNK